MKWSTRTQEIVSEMVWIFMFNCLKLNFIALAVKIKWLIMVERCDHCVKISNQSNDVFSQTMFSQQVENSILYYVINQGSIALGLWMSVQQEKGKDPKRKGRKITIDFELIVFVWLSWRALLGEHGGIFLTMAIRKDQRVRPLHI